MHVKLRSADEHQGPFGCAKYFLNRRKNYQKFPLFGKESPSTGESLYRLTSKFLTAFTRSTARIKFTDRPKITFLQSCEKIVQCAPAVGVKMWCLLPAVLPQSVKHRGITFTHGQKSGYSPLWGDSLHRCMSNSAAPTSSWVHLAVQNFASIGTKTWECGPKISKISTFW